VKIALVALLIRFMLVWLCVFALWYFVWCSK